MKVVILAGGLGSRLQEETEVRPKPMVEIGGKPMLWHIMNIYAAAGFDEFVIALGYKGEVIKEYFLHFFALNNDLSIDLASGDTTVHSGSQPHWRIHLVDTGLHTQTGGRLKRLREWIGDETFMMTYGDGVADLDVAKLLEFHGSHGKMATVTAVRPPSRFGAFAFEGNRVLDFNEKPQTEGGWINGGFFVLEPGVLDLIDDDATKWERAPMERLADRGELMAFPHSGFWQPMDTLRERQLLDEMWQSGDARWKVWA